MIVLTGKAAEVVAGMEAKEKELGVELRELNEAEQVQLFLIERAFQVDERYAEMISTFTELYACIMQEGNGRDLAKLSMLLHATHEAFSDALKNRK